MSAVFVPLFFLLFLNAEQNGNLNEKRRRLRRRLWIEEGEDDDDDNPEGLGQAVVSLRLSRRISTQ